MGIHNLARSVEETRTVRLTVVADKADAERPVPAPEIPAAARALAPGSTLLHYKLLQTLGQGGMGTVFKAHDAQLDRTVAMKVLPPQQTDAAFIQRFRTEARAHARLQHTNVVTLHALHETPEGLVLVMEYLEGETLAERIARDGPLAAREAVRIFDLALAGVEAAHGAHIVHRDLKPANIFLTHDGGVKLLDFGVASMLDNGEADKTDDARAVLGTLLYIAPEQLRGEEAGPRADIYALGISLFEAVTGRLPFERKTDFAILHAHAVQNPPRPCNIRRGLPRGLNTAILRAIEKEPERRFETATEFRTVLRAAVNRAPPIARARARRATKSMPFWRRFSLDAALLAVALGLLGVLGLHPGISRMEPAPAARTAAVTEASTHVIFSEDLPDIQPSTPPQAKAATVKTVVARTSRRDKYEVLRDAWGG
jgi:serine/threonine-protein kinase